MTEEQLFEASMKSYESGDLDSALHGFEQAFKSLEGYFYLRHFPLRSLCLYWYVRCMSEMSLDEKLINEVSSLMKDHNPLSLGQKVVEYYIISCVKTNKYDEALDMECYRMKYDGYSIGDSETFKAMAEAAMAKHEIESAIRYLEQSIEQDYFLYGSNSENVLETRKKLVWLYLYLEDTKKVLINLDSILDAYDDKSGVKSREFLCGYGLAYKWCLKRWNIDQDKEDNGYNSHLKKVLKRLDNQELDSREIIISVVGEELYESKLRNELAML